MTTTKLIQLSAHDRAIARGYLERYGREVADGCVLWTGPFAGPKDSPQRPLLHLPGRRRFYAYRVAWVLRHGELAPEALICHKCDNGMCVNTDHMFTGTQAENVADMRSKGRDVPLARRSGAAHHYAVHSDAKVAEVVAMWATGRYASYADLGRAAGVSRTCARAWVLGLARTTKPIPADQTRAAS